MQRRFILASMVCFALILPCLGQSSENKSAPNHFGKINAAPLRDMAGKVFEMCNSGGANQSTNSFSVLNAFEVDPDGSIARSSIKILKTSGSTAIDETALQVVWLIGESHILGALSALPPKTFEIKLSDRTMRLALILPAASAEEARAKSEQLRFLLGVIKFAQKARNPLVSELLDRLEVKPEDKRITADLELPCSRIGEMLQTLK